MRWFAIIMVFVCLFVNASAEGIIDKMEAELGVEGVDETVPQSITENELLEGVELNYRDASSTLNILSVFKSFLGLLFNGLESLIPFALSVVAFLIVASVYKAFSSSIKSSALNECIDISVLVFLFTILHKEIILSVDTVVSYVNELTGFMTSLMPFFITVMCAQGSVAEATTSGAFVVTVIAVIEKVCTSFVIPFVKILFVVGFAGVISKLNISSITDFFTTFAVKCCTISMSVISAVLYFQHALSSSADSLALRSVKLAAGNFIPIVGSMVSEASGTVIAGARLVKTSLGVFAFAVLLYVTLIPIVSFLCRKIVVRCLISLSSLLGCDDATKIISSVYSVYNILSALMFSCGCFFIIAIGIFVKNGVAQ